MKLFTNKKIIVTAKIITTILILSTSSIMAQTTNSNGEVNKETVQQEVTTGSAITLANNNPPVEESEEVQEENTSTFVVKNEDIEEVTLLEPMQQAITTESAIVIKPIVFSDRVYNTKTNQGIKNVKVNIYNNDEIIHFTETDSEGYFTIEVIPGEYLLIFEKQGFKSTEKYININN